MKARTKMLLVVGTSVMVLTLLVLAVVYGPGLQAERARRSLVDGIRVGMSRSEVIAAKGPPDHIGHSPPEMRAAGYYPAPPEPVDEEVLEYNDFVWRLWVYIGSDDRVTRYSLART